MLSVPAGGVIDDDFGADQGLDAGLGGCLPEAGRARDRVAIHQRHHRQLELGRPSHEIFRLRGAFQEREGGRAMKFCVAPHGVASELKVEG
jgi:hypothetical protein